MRKRGESLASIFLTYLRLGCLSFGGPVAHIGYFRDAFVTRLKWMKESEFAESLALCQFIPGPSSSQLGFLIGYHRAGLAGASAAWLGFTLPSAILMMGFAYGLAHFSLQGSAFVGGLLAAAVAVVANATLGLGRKLCNGTVKTLIGILSAAFAYLLSGSTMQVAVILLGGLAGLLFLHEDSHKEEETDNLEGLQPRAAILPAILFSVLLCLTFFAPASIGSGSLLAEHYKAGSLVFGGGHVVLPLLHGGLVPSDLVSEETFLAGYSAAQALPGPLFTFSTFLGSAYGGWLVGIGATIAMFLPGILLVLAILPIWQKVRSKPSALAFIAGANAAVVGFLLAVLAGPVWARGIETASDLFIGIVAFLALARFKIPAWIVVLGSGTLATLFA